MAAAAITMHEFADVDVGSFVKDVVANRDRGRILSLHVIGNFDRNIALRKQGE